MADNPETPTPAPQKAAPAAPAPADPAVPIHRGPKPPQGQEREWVPRERLNEVSTRVSELQSELDTYMDKYEQTQGRYQKLEQRFERETTLLSMADDYPVLKQPQARQRLYRDYRTFAEESGSEAPSLSDYVTGLKDDVVWGAHFQPKAQQPGPADPEKGGEQPASNAPGQPQPKAKGAPPVNGGAEPAGGAAKMPTPQEIRAAMTGTPEERAAMMERLNSIQVRV